MSNIKAFIEELQTFEAGQGVFNPWKDYANGYDIGPDAPEIRSRHLEEFLRLRVGRAKWMLVGEAVGYQGGRFSGVALVSERILLGYHNRVHPSAILASSSGARTSDPECKYFKYRTQALQGFNEPTATIVWEAIIDKGISPFEIVTWNTFPFHPFHPKNGFFSNRFPKEEEVKLGVNYLRQLIRIFPETNIIAVGRTAERALHRQGIRSIHIPHPSNGGANDFREAFRSIFEGVG